MISQSYSSQSHPPLHALWGSLQVLTWYYLKPSVWHNYVRQNMPSLSPLFCLADLQKTEWRSPDLQRLLWHGYVVGPAITGIVIALLSWGTSWLDPFALFAWALGVLVGVTIGIGASVAGGIVVAIVGSGLFGLLFGTTGLLFIDILSSTRYACGFGAINIIMLSVSLNLSRQRTALSPVRQAGSYLVGAMSSLLLFGLSIGAIFLAFNGRNDGLLNNYSTGVTTIGIPAICIGTAVSWRTGQWKRGLIVMLLLVTFYGVIVGNSTADYGKNAFGATLMATNLMVTAFVYLIVFIGPYAFVERIAGPLAGSIAGVIGSLGIYIGNNSTYMFFNLWPNLAVALLLIVVGLSMHWWRPALFYPFEFIWNRLLYRLDEFYQPTSPYFRWHTLFWDELQFFPQIGLDDHLVLVEAYQPTPDAKILEFVAQGKQSWAAQRAQAELTACQLETYASIEEIADAHLLLPTLQTEDDVGGLLFSLRRPSEDVKTALAQRGSYNQRLVLTDVRDRLNNLLQDLTLRNTRYAIRVRPIVSRWRDLVAAQIDTLVRSSLDSQEIENPYIIGPPLTRQQQIFVGRTDISQRIEGVLQDRDHPPLLLFGQRRMGKTSLLYQLQWLLPNRIASLFIDLQGSVATSKSNSEFLYNFAKGIRISAQRQGLTLRALAYQELVSNPFTNFDDWIDEVEEAQVEQGCNTTMLAIDEFESLAEAIDKGYLDQEDILGTLRHIIQHRPHFKIMLAGSHTLDEFRRWSNYFINAQVIHLSYLQEDETYQLIEKPSNNFVLNYESEASQYIRKVTRGHPYLVQLLCNEIVIRKNEQELAHRRFVTINDVQESIPYAISRGSQFFANIEDEQVDKRGAEVLSFLAHQGEEASITEDSVRAMFSGYDNVTDIITLLLQRELIEEVNDGYQFQVEMIRRWFA